MEGLALLLTKPVTLVDCPLLPLAAHRLLPRQVCDRGSWVALTAFILFLFFLFIFSSGGSRGRRWRYHLHQSHRFSLFPGLRLPRLARGCLGRNWQDTHCHILVAHEPFIFDHASKTGGSFCILTSSPSFFLSTFKIKFPHWIHSLIPDLLNFLSKGSLATYHIGGPSKVRSIGSLGQN